jgi:ribosome-interacting GTPase 1
VIESTDKIGMLRVYMPCVYVCNMIDKISIEELGIIHTHRKRERERERER